MASDFSWLMGLSARSVVAPAGHGKTELLARAAAQGQRTLILTHTHAGVHAIAARIRRMGIAKDSVTIDTIASWASRYAYAFPKLSGNPPRNPKGAEWNQVYQGALNVLSSPITWRIVQASYDRAFIDEYQDCEGFQHAIAVTLSRIIPTLVFGDPMQGIFEFVETKINWGERVIPDFPVAAELEEPHRWSTSNPALGKWIADTRNRLIAGQPVDLRQGPITYLQTDNAFDMGLFFDGFDDREGSTAAIHCRRKICDSLASATRGAFQAIEEIAAARLMAFAAQWDASLASRQKIEALRSLLGDTMHRNLAQLTVPDSLYEIDARRQAAWNALIDTGSAQSGSDVISHERGHPLSRTFRGELLNDAKRALIELACGRSESLTQACQHARHRLSHTGRPPIKRVISTPLLLKGLEFDHVLVPDATHFLTERFAAAKLFYVAISRARHSLSIASSNPILLFPRPTL
ncbi:UvrD-helicase domain-containing protein [Pseudomonas sp. HN2-3]|uniref:UvrD-helicase domain-containing protein n=1 Tax=Pseudomonas sp. HN2-3 TaxID=2886360 RepID=UPI001D0FF839|nr:UvrD-helicase domain-containing protein [Pseudomonas sp. HN2-3]UDU83115.1 ATP-dependent helicase [Pseudomonas sp. HN2-3]